MAKGKKGGSRPQEIEKRLNTAYEAGYFDGWAEAAETTHEIWLHISETTKGMGPVLQKRFFDRAVAVMRERSSKKFGKPPQDVEDVRAVLQEGQTDETAIQTALCDVQ